MSLKLELYIEKYVIPEIVSNLEDEELISFKAENSKSLDSFMSCLYFIQLKTKTEKGEKERLLLAKFMRGDKAFRETSKTYIQYANEIYTYNTIIPEYENLLRDLKVKEINVRDLVPPVYISKFGYIEGLSSSAEDKEACLVLEHMKPKGYQLGPRLELNRDHLLAMCKPLGQWNAFSYALKALNPFLFEKLRKGIVEFRFLNEEDPNDGLNNVYRTVHRYAFDRLYDYYDRLKQSNFFDKTLVKDRKLMSCLDDLREKYFDLPSRLQEKFRTKVLDSEEDCYFAAFLHGDYNRNNVLFKYKENNEKGKDGLNLVEDVKMIDFQQLRYASPVLDLSFFMYFNSSERERSLIWQDLLKTYHETMFSTLSMTLKASKLTNKEVDQVLLHYSFEKFEKHFARFAFFGVVICLHFLPLMLCEEKVCDRMSELFASDIHGEEFRKLSLEAGGDEVNGRFLNVIRHACEMGYMDDL